MTRICNIQGESLPQLSGQNALELQRIEGREALSELYAYKLTLMTPDDPGITEYVSANVDYKALVGKELTVTIEVEGGAREISGLVTKARYVRSENRRSVYEAILEPWLTLATRTSDYKIFQNQSVLDTVNEVLSDYAFPTEIRTSQSYSRKDFVVQYGESDFDFISRLMGEWGIYFYFEHSDQRHRLVLVDGPGAHKPFAGSREYGQLNYYPANTANKDGEEFVSEFAMAEGLQSGAWVSDDFDFTTPKAKLQQKSKMPRKTGNAEQEMYQWPGGFTKEWADREEARHLTRVRMEAAGTEGSRGLGAGKVRAIVTGNLFTLNKHPNDKSNQEYLVTSSTLFLQDVGQSSGQQDYECICRFEVIPNRKFYRPRVALDEYGRPRKPRTSGPQTAIVTGPQGREIYTDEYGRVKLHFHWNRYCSMDENSSCWVRVSSPWAGNKFGGISIPRIGQEVIVDFEGGDPERPIVTGRVYNGQNMPPWQLPANQTQSGLLTRSTEGASLDMGNSMRFEDKIGQEGVLLNGQKDLVTNVNNDSFQTVGNVKTTLVGNKKINCTPVKKTRIDHLKVVVDQIARVEGMTLSMTGVTIGFTGINTYYIGCIAGIYGSLTNINFLNNSNTIHAQSHSVLATSVVGVSVSNTGFSNSETGLSNSITGASGSVNGYKMFG